MTSRFLTTLTALGLTAVTTLSAQANDYPDHALDVIVAFNPGGGTDVAARTIEP